MKDLVTRKCIVSGEILGKEELLRFVVLEGVLLPDFSKKLPGKGIYVKNSYLVLKQAIEKKNFSKVAKKNLGEKLEILEIVENLLKKKALDSINFAKKAGILITGFEKVRGLIISKRTAFLHEATDGGDDGHSKIVSLAKDLEIYSLYSIEELDKALDRTNTVHIAFTKSEMAKIVYKDFNRLKKFKQI